MSNTKHEPGPWILGGASGRMVTTPSGYYGDGFIADVDTIANAKLIAAAPELLDQHEKDLFVLRQLFRLDNLPESAYQAIEFLIEEKETLIKKATE